MPDNGLFKVGELPNAGRDPGAFPAFVFGLLSDLQAKHLFN